MSWIAVLLIGWAVADLTHSVRPVRIVPEATGAVVAILVGLLAGLTEPLDVPLSSSSPASSSRGARP